LSLDTAQQVDSLTGFRKNDAWSCLFGYNLDIILCNYLSVSGRKAALAWSIAQQLHAEMAASFLQSPDELRFFCKRKTEFLPLLLPGLFFENDEQFFCNLLSVLYFFVKIKMNEKCLPGGPG